MNEFPVTTRTQRRIERRQMVMMIILVIAVTVASFFVGVMVGERGSSSGGEQGDEGYRVPMAQVPPPPLPASATAAPRKLTFYDDLPKGNAAPLGSGINLPKTAYVPSPSSSPPTAASAVVPSTPVPTATASKPAAPPAPAPATAAPVKANAGGAFVVQVAATKDQAEAKRMVEKLKGQGYTATSERADLGKKGVWYRVVVGPYAGQAAADQAAAQLKQLKFAGIVRKK